MTSPSSPPPADDRDPVTSEAPTEELRPCPSCGRPTGAGRACENCAAPAGASDVERAPLAEAGETPVPVGVSSDTTRPDVTRSGPMATDPATSDPATTDPATTGPAGAVTSDVAAPASSNTGSTAVTAETFAARTTPDPVPEAGAPPAGGSDDEGETAPPTGSETPPAPLPPVGSPTPAAAGTSGPGPSEGAATADATSVDVAPGSAPRSAGMLVLGGILPEEPVAAPAPAPEEGSRCACGGTFADGYCEQCGSPVPAPRAHIEDAPAPWVSGVCDIGVRHRSNQDAMALFADGARAALVVCDGVSSAMRSEDASQAAADAAVAVLSRATSTGVGVPSSVVPALLTRLDTAAEAAADAVADVTGQIHCELGIDSTREGDTFHANPSCTFVAAIVEAGHVVVGSIGDSRAYWFPDAGEAQRLTVDDSWAEEQIALGATREQAESGPGSHTITRWLGIDCDDHTPRTATLRIDAPGWLVLCSDGLWNYASEPTALAEVLGEIAHGIAGTEAVTSPVVAPLADPHTGAPVDPVPPAATAPDPTVPTAPAATGTDASATAPEAADQDGTTVPLALARGLVQWANARGGHDNITVIAARLTPDAPTQEA
ncbi:protein phosphatase 2C domain-containing protein [Mobilicoccus pelagius]|uniref:Putative serine/threonine protein phosphatase n=1 Tax=Mobilicoccus pelagius NBRC 104925 TaxID=1089455 RepID=H5UVV6_9MICO|nr:protein phosphatase 2C domain-containing protein [Mobilicoccus pelagius]GAB49864.1 putative serine/threonine protein phosphatase [Mobilicoccus pelagius NBRC 104925]